jgi:hypothetical protein
MHKNFLTLFLFLNVSAFAMNGAEKKIRAEETAIDFIHCNDEDCLVEDLIKANPKIAQAGKESQILHGDVHRRLKTKNLMKKDPELWHAYFKVMRAKIAARSSLAYREQYNGKLFCVLCKGRIYNWAFDFYEPCRALNSPPFDYQTFLRQRAQSLLVEKEPHRAHAQELGKDKGLCAFDELASNDCPLLDEKQQQEKIKALVKAGFDINGYNAHGLTPLQHYITGPDPKTDRVQLLLSCQADVALPAKTKKNFPYSGKNAFQIAVQHNRAQLTQEFTNHYMSQLQDILANKAGFPENPGKHVAHIVTGYALE